LRSGYWQVPVAEDSKDKLAFITPFGLYQYARTPMGFKNAPAHFMRAIDIMLSAEGVREFNATYVDDVTTHGRSFEEYAANQERVFQVLATNHWLVAADKLRLGYTHISLLGWRVGGGEKRAEPSKLEGIAKLLPPTNAT
jgi:Reverse transcriptase (RNA-dependent DNA polymerase)